MPDRRAEKLDELSPEAFAALMSAAEDDYSEGRVIALDDGWIVSETEARTLGGQAPRPKAEPPVASGSAKAKPDQG